VLSFVKASWVLAFCRLGARNVPASWFCISSNCDIVLLIQRCLSYFESLLCHGSEQCKQMCNIMCTTKVPFISCRLARQNTSYQLNTYLRYADQHLRKHRHDIRSSVTIIHVHGLMVVPNLQRRCSAGSLQDTILVYCYMLRCSATFREQYEMTRLRELDTADSIALRDISGHSEYP
jgi:hypothetical protein